MQGNQVVDSAAPTNMGAPAGQGGPMPGTPEWTQMWVNAMRKQNPSWTPPQQGAAAPTGGSPSDPAASPFMTGQNMMDFGGAQLQYQQGSDAIDQGVEGQRINHDYEVGQNEKARVGNRDAAQWNMGGRGLGQSSIRDGALYDIDATAVIRKNFLDTQLQTAITNAGTAHTRLNDWWTTFQSGMNRQQVENVPPRTDPGPQGQPGAQQAPAQGQQQQGAAPPPSHASDYPVFRGMGIPGDTQVKHGARGPYFTQPAAGGGEWHIYGPGPSDRVLVKPGQH